MSPSRRPLVRQNLSPRRARRGLGGATPSAPPQLAVTAAPPGQFRNAITTSGASVRLQTSGGQNILLAGVSVTVRTPLGSLATLSSTPTAAVTNASGIATFTDLTMTGKIGTYSIEFLASGYTTAISTGHVLVAGIALPSQSTAIVPNGSTGQTTTVRILLRDANANRLFVPGSNPVTVQVTGSNPVPQTTVPFDTATSDYRFTYTPSIAGTDTVIVRYGGTAISGSPYTSIVSGSGGGGFTANSLRVGFFAAHDVVGTGPQLTGGTWDTREPIYRMVHGNFTPTELEAAIAIAGPKNVTLVVTMPGGPGTYTDTSGTCQRYNHTKFTDKVQTYAGRPIITAALANRSLIWYMFDEPWHRKYCDSMPPSIARAAFRYVKGVWPDSLIIGRLEPHYLRGNTHWGPPAEHNLPINYFDKMDYCFCTYRGALRTPSIGETPRQYYQRGKALVEAAGYGTVYSHNWINLGDDYCWKAFGTGDNRDGRIHGSQSTTQQDGVVELCSVPSSDIFWIEDPARHLQCVQAAAEDPDCPMIFNWLHTASGLLLPVFTDIQKRSDFVQCGINMIRIGEARANFTGWREPK